MYLKNIEVQGFKSFANKITFDFHNGITAIVGPNGSGKSNVADAVRWVLGEQRAKQLRGAKMEDVIFAGTETRKPVGYAYVSITLDNSDHALPVEYDEVIVSRRVFRSGESEYLINGNICRLKDVTELFYDTGIGKEGYSIIGQGQIDKILSGKPEERRELFDEAAGIVKFKRRKETAQKKLENEKMNLVRVKDILAELEKQIDPLQKQSEKAKEYLNLKHELKIYDVNGFLLETGRMKTTLNELNQKLDIARNDLSRANTEYESTKAEYEEAEQKLTYIHNEIETTNKLQSDTELDQGRLEGQINVLKEKIKTIEVNNRHFGERITSVDSEIVRHAEQKQQYLAEKEELLIQLNELTAQQNDAKEKQEQITSGIQEITERIENHKTEIFRILNDKSSVKAKNQRYETMLEQILIRKEELTDKILKGKNEEANQDAIIKELQEQLDKVNKITGELTASVSAYENQVIFIKDAISKLTAEIEKEQQQYHKARSTYESLRNITERYDGYGNSIRKVMEQKSSNSGIMGVIADIIKVERKYETAIETALGGTIQNIVTDTEKTAKTLIEYLKKNQFGRATFLPIASISGKNTLEKDPCMKEEGVIGIASSLVKVSFEYENLAKYLLGRTLVVDHIDHALAIAKKYKYTLRIVTVEGEQLNPGGSMTGGAFKNASNLLGRRREIEELKTNISEISKSIEAKKAYMAEKRRTLADTREKLESDNKILREKQLNKNTIEMNHSQAIRKKQEIIVSYGKSESEVAEIERQNEEITASLSEVEKDINELDMKNNQTETGIMELSALLDGEKQKEAEQKLQLEKINLEYSAFAQKDSFIQNNLDRVEAETVNLRDEIETLRIRMGETDAETAEKEKAIALLRLHIEETKKQTEDCAQKANRLKTERDEVTSGHKVFFEKREALSKTIGDLDKECYRLDTQKEKLEEANEVLAEYMWNEYEITYNKAKELRQDGLDDLKHIRKNIAQLKLSIKSLGDVNVNAIEEYKNVSERYTFLKGQHDDLTEAERSLTGIIEELDNGMRIQFESKFNEIRVEFDKVFKELFGGGKGTIELVEGEDILEAGILIISQPPGKKLQNMMQLSGGEKALTAISLLFAIQNLKPSPFCMLDEIEAALDDSNVDRFAKYLHKLTKHIQFIIITHRRGTMSYSDRLYGITMQEKGVSTLVSVDLIQNDLENNEKE